MGAAICMAAALAACGGGGGGGGPVNPPVTTPTPTPTPTVTPQGATVTLSGSQQTATIPPTGGFSGTVTVPTGSGTINVTDSTANPSGVTLQSAGAPRAEATATPTPNPYGCVGTTTYSKTGTHTAVAAPPHPIAGGDTFAYSGSLSSTYAQSAPCPEPTATSNATVAVSVAATPTALPGVSGTVSDLKSTEADAFPTETTTTVTDQYVQNTGSYVLYEQKSSDTAGNSLDRKYTAPQVLDQLTGTGSWTNANPAGTLSETLADGTTVARTIAADGSYTESENFPNLQTTSRSGILYFTVTAETNATINGVPGFTLTVPANITGSVSLAVLSNGTWTTLEGPVSISGSTATFPVSAGSFTMTAGQKVYFAIFQTTTSTTASGSATISVKGQATGSSIDGSGTYSIAGTTFAYAAPTGPAGSGSITLTIGSGTTRTFPAWFTVPASYITDSFVDNGQVNFDPNCSVNGTISTQAGGKGNQIVETNSTLDPVLGYQETRVTTSYVVNGYGAVCVKIDDTLNSFYDYQNDTTKIDYQSQNGSPNSVDHIVEYLGMSSPAVAYPSVRTQSVTQQAVSPLIVAQHVAAIQLHRDEQRAAQIRALLKGNAR